MAQPISSKRPPLQHQQLVGNVAHYPAWRLQPVFLHGGRRLVLVVPLPACTESAMTSTGLQPRHRKPGCTAMLGALGPCSMPPGCPQESFDHNPQPAQVAIRPADRHATPTCVQRSSAIERVSCLLRLHAGCHAFAFAPYPLSHLCAPPPIHPPTHPGVIIRTCIIIDPCTQPPAHPAHRNFAPHLRGPHHSSSHQAQGKDDARAELRQQLQCARLDLWQHHWQPTSQHTSSA